MSNKELKATISQCRYWLVELTDKLPFPFSEHVAIITGELAKRIKAEEEKDSADLDH